MEGFDEDEDSLTEPLLGEGGLTMATRFAFKLVEVELFRTAEP
jgi:hypothetical protein